MAIPVQAARIGLHGVLPTGETFETGFWLAENTVSSQAAATAEAEAIAALFTTTSVPNLYSMLGTDSSWAGVRTYHYPNGGPNATYAGEADFAVQPGTGTLSDMPLQSCTVVSLRTGVIGRSNRGRMYLPHVNTTLVVNQISSANAIAIADQVADFLSAVNASASVSGTVSVVSPLTTSSRPVTEVIVDTRIDIQRRRAAQQAVSSSASADVV